MSHAAFIISATILGLLFLVVNTNEMPNNENLKMPMSRPNLDVPLNLLVDQNAVNTDAFKMMMKLMETDAFMKQISEQLSLLQQSSGKLEGKVETQLTTFTSLQSQLAQRLTALETTNSLLKDKIDDETTYDRQKTDVIARTVNTASSSLSGINQGAQTLLNQVSSVNDELKGIRENMAKLTSNQHDQCQRKNEPNERIEASLEELRDVLKVLNSTSNVPPDVVDAIFSWVHTANTSIGQLREIVSEIKEFTKNETLDETRPADCSDLLMNGVKESGIYDIYPRSLGGTKHIKVYCDMDTRGGGWTVIQRRDAKFKPRIDFYRGWAEYKYGFGLLDQEFWLGLENIRALTSSQDYKLRFDLFDFDSAERYAEYSFFSLEDESSKYKMDLGEYVGDSGDSFTAHKGMKFTSKDQDNDNAGENCAVTYRGAWWHNKCHVSNINGRPYEGEHKTFADGIEWKEWRGYHYSLRKTEMKVRTAYL